MNLRNSLFFLTLARRSILRTLAENLLPKLLAKAFFKVTNPDIPNRNCYLPYFTAYKADPDFNQLYAELEQRTIVSRESVWILHELARQSCHVDGNFLEAGVYKGGTAKFLKRILESTPNKILRLFDTFEGMPETDKAADFHKPGDFDDTNLKEVMAWVGKEGVTYHPGFMPSTFIGLENEKFAFAHIDVDIKASVRSCCEFIYPRMSSGGVMIFDDYGYPSCPGARAAVDEYFSDKPERPIVMAHAQAFVFKL